MIRRLAKFPSVILASVLIVLALGLPARAADAAFAAWLQSVWPEAQKAGITRATFDAATRGLEPDLSLPDLVIPGRVQPQPGQPEFVQTPAQYLKDASFDR
ncbi:MAG TPA: lytic murein transglycosylase, partial [Xanthobacteraceae bacterium]|nr:lytic murein transglycosylase [Xanthobacteraceae bacterium]